MKRSLSSVHRDGDLQARLGLRSGNWPRSSTGLAEHDAKSSLEQSGGELLCSCWATEDIMGA